MTISTTTIKNSYSGNGSTSAFTYTFKITDQDDIEVLIRSSNGTETTKTITTHYTVSGVGNAGGGTVTFTAGNIPTSTETVVLRRATPQTQGLDLIENDPLPANSLEDAFDKLTSISQELQEEVDRSIKLSRTNTITSTEFTVDAATRANKILAFDANGEIAVTQELGSYKGNWSAGTSYSARDIVKDTSNNNIYISNTAHTSSGSLPLSSNADSAKWDLLVDAASATSSASAAATSATNASNSATAAAASAAAAATSESNASTSESNASTSETNAASSASAASTSASNAASSEAAAAAIFDNFDDSYLGAKASNPSVDNDGDPLEDGALYFDTTNNVMKVYDLGTTTWFQLTPTVANQNNINTVAAISADITQAATDSADIQTVAADSADIQTLADIEDGTVATNAISNAGTNTANITTVAGQISPTNNIATVASVSADITSVAGQISPTNNIQTVANADANITTVAADLAGSNYITAVGTDIVNVNLCWNGSIVNVNTVATNIADVNSFANTYRIAASAPVTSLDVGDLYFDTTANELKVYKASGWSAAGSTVNGTSARFTYNITGTPSSVSGADANGDTLAYDAGFADVYVNGVRMSASDITISSGTSVVFATALLDGDVVDVVAYGTFNVAAIDASNITSGTLNAARIGSASIDLTTKVTGVLPYANGGTGLSSLGSAGQALKVNSGGTALEFGDVSISLSYTKGTNTGDNSTTAFTINSGRSVNDVLVLVNGFLLTPTTDYTISSTTLTFVTAPASSAEIVVRYLPLNNSGVYTNDTATGDNSTTAFTIDSGRTVEDVIVTVNGVTLVPATDYTISGTTLTFTTAPTTSAEISIRYLRLT
jgi:hypothetical protein